MSFCPRELIATMTDSNANALEQDADDDADAVDSWMLFLRAPALTLDADQVLQSLVQITVQGVHYRKPVAHVQSPTSRHQRRAQPRATVRPRHFDSRPSDPVASSASFLGDCSAASASATSCFGASRAHECFITGGTKVRRYMDEIDQEIRPSTYLLTYLLIFYLFFT